MFVRLSLLAKISQEFATLVIQTPLGTSAASNFNLCLILTQSTVTNTTTFRHLKCLRLIALTHFNAYFCMQDSVVCVW